MIVKRNSCCKLLGTHFGQVLLAAVTSSAHETAPATVRAEFDPV